MNGYTCLAICVAVFALAGITERICNYLKVKARSTK